MLYDEPLMVVATSEGADQAIQTYEKRFGIEPMFKDQKSNGLSALSFGQHKTPFSSTFPGTNERWL
jgi:hypothetical protein